MVTCVSLSIEIDDCVIGISVQQMANEIATYKAQSTGKEQLHGDSSINDDLVTIHGHGQRNCQNKIFHCHTLEIKATYLNERKSRIPECVAQPISVEWPAEAFQSS